MHNLWTVETLPDLNKMKEENDCLYALCCTFAKTIGTFLSFRDDIDLLMISPYAWNKFVASLIIAQIGV